ncbi:MAG: pyridoxamine 5'-phosphate oxidase [Acidobacteriota bacterium]|nr:pyridoxamine 5'-phosphate oxidase [Acidobacteriota bacterium]
MREATATEPNDPEAVALATAASDGAPSVRMVLMKHIAPEGFSFYTNAESQKGRELQQNPRAAMCFHWKTQRRQVRVAGVVRSLAAEQADTYFHSRARRSQIGAAVSRQSRPLACREDLVHAARELEERCPGEVPRPAYWRGYTLVAERIEFWQDGEFRLHDRIVFTRAGGRWHKSRLYP